MLTASVEGCVRNAEARVVQPHWALGYLYHAQMAHESCVKIWGTPELGGDLPAAQVVKAGSR